MNLGPPPSSPAWPPSPKVATADLAPLPSRASYAMAAARLTLRGALWVAWLWSPLWTWLYHDRPLWMTDRLNEPMGPLGHWFMISLLSPWLVGIPSAALYFVASFIRHLITRAVTAEAKRIEAQRRSRTIAIEGARAQGGALSLPDEAPGALSLAEEPRTITAPEGETVVVDANARRMPSPPPPPPVSH